MSQKFKIKDNHVIYNDISQAVIVVTYFSVISNSIPIETLCCQFYSLNAINRHNLSDANETALLKTLCSFQRIASVREKPKDFCLY